VRPIGTSFTTSRLPQCRTSGNPRCRCRVTCKADPTSNRTLAYGERTHVVLRDLSHTQDALKFLSGRPLYVEKWLPFFKENAITVVLTCFYPVLETVYKGICHIVFGLLQRRYSQLAARAQDIAEGTVRSLSGAGVFGVGDVDHDRRCVQPFLSFPNKLTVSMNVRRKAKFSRTKLRLDLTTRDITPPERARPRNTRIISTPRSPPYRLDCTQSAMFNQRGSSNDMSELVGFEEFVLGAPYKRVHLYGKRVCHKGRKTGHITITANSDPQAPRSPPRAAPASPGRRHSRRRRLKYRIYMRLRYRGRVWGSLTSSRWLS
jgi:phosphoribosylaminoimidazole carboxylase